MGVCEYRRWSRRRHPLRWASHVWGLMFACSGHSTNFRNGNYPTGTQNGGGVPVRQSTYRTDVESVGEGTLRRLSSGPEISVTNVTFTDSSPVENQIAGTVTWSPPVGWNPAPGDMPIYIAFLANDPLENDKEVVLWDQSGWPAVPFGVNELTFQPIARQLPTSAVLGRYIYVVPAAREQVMQKTKLDETAVTAYSSVTIRGNTTSGENFTTPLPVPLPLGMGSAGTAGASTTTSGPLIGAAVIFVVALSAGLPAGVAIWRRKSGTVAKTAPAWVSPVPEYRAAALESSEKTDVSKSAIPSSNLRATAPAETHPLEHPAVIRLQAAARLGAAAAAVADARRACLADIASPQDRGTTNAGAQHDMSQYHGFAQTLDPRDGSVGGASPLWLAIPSPVVTFPQTFSTLAANPSQPSSPPASNALQQLEQCELAHQNVQAAMSQRVPVNTGSPLFLV
eukprot:TRINITY_DN3952_c0_g1_i1.p1 TRINITY_DN3952_c0_g1~~TRINITY_DN3952_c0_g1_i1.p1  ORF type:complete len:480 (+),score=48.47 TRINITY_DN3952_c0_g1_i1:84-1442(+)